MKSIIKSINKLVRKCDGMWLQYQYKNILFEIDELLISLVGKDADIYQNFEMICQKQELSIAERGQYMVGILNGLKHQLRISGLNKKYQIFVSSTYLDLIDYRKFVADEIIFKGHIPV